MRLKEFYEKKIAEKEMEIERLREEMVSATVIGDYKTAREKRAEIVRTRLSIYDLEEDLDDVISGLI